MRRECREGLGVEPPAMDKIFLIQLWNGGDYSDSVTKMVRWFPSRGDAEAFKADLEAWLQSPPDLSLAETIAGPDGLTFAAGCGIESDWDAAWSSDSLREVVVSIVPLRRGGRGELGGAP